MLAIDFIREDKEYYKVFLDGRRIGNLFKNNRRMWEIIPNEQSDPETYEFFAAAFDDATYDLLSVAKRFIRVAALQYKAMKK